MVTSLNTVLCARVATTSVLAARHSSLRGAGNLTQQAVETQSTKSDRETTNQLLGGLHAYHQSDTEDQPT